MVSISICCCLLTMLMYLMEAIVFHSTALNFYIIYSCVLNGNFNFLSHRLFICERTCYAMYSKPCTEMMQAGSNQLWLDSCLFWTPQLGSDMLIIRFDFNVNLKTYSIFTLFVQNFFIVNLIRTIAQFRKKKWSVII